MNETQKILVKSGAEVVLVPAVYKIITNVSGEVVKAPQLNKFGQILETVAKVAITACIADFTSTYVTDRIEIIMKSFAAKG